MRIRSVLTHSGEALFEGLLIALLVVGLMAGTAFAGGRGGGGKPTGGGTISNPQMVTDLNGNGLSNHKDSITFTVSAATAMPMVGLRCWQGTMFVHDGYIALYDASWLAKYFTLDSSYWDAGVDARCTARLFYYDNRGRERVLATEDFGVAP